MAEAEQFATDFRTIAITYRTLPLMHRAEYLARAGDALINEIAANYDRDSLQTASSPNQRAVAGILGGSLRLARGDFYTRALRAVRGHSPGRQMLRGKRGQFSDDPAHPFFICRLLGLRMEGATGVAFDPAADRRTNVMTAIEEAGIASSLVTIERLSALLRQSLPRELAALGRLAGIPKNRAIGRPAKGREDQFWQEHLIGYDASPGLYSTRAYSAQLMAALTELLPALESRTGVSGDQILVEFETIERMEAERLGPVHGALLRRGLYSLLEADPLEAGILLAAVGRRFPALFRAPTLRRLEKVALANADAVATVLDRTGAKRPPATPRERAADVMHTVERSLEARQAYAASLAGHIFFTSDRTFQYALPGDAAQTRTLIPYRWVSAGQFVAVRATPHPLKEFLAQVRQFETVTLTTILREQPDPRSPHAALFRAIAHDPSVLRNAAGENGITFEYPEGLDLPEPTETPPPPAPDSVQVRAIERATGLMLDGFELWSGTRQHRPDQRAAEGRVSQAVKLLAGRNAMNRHAVYQIEAGARTRLEDRFEEFLAKRRAKAGPAAKLDEDDTRSRIRFGTQLAQLTLFIRSHLTDKLPSRERAGQSRAGRVTSTQTRAVTTDDDRLDPSTRHTAAAKPSSTRSTSARHSNRPAARPALASPRQERAVRRANVQPDYEQPPAGRPGRRGSAEVPPQDAPVHAQLDSAGQPDRAPAAEQPGDRPPNGSDMTAREGSVIKAASECEPSF